MMITQLCEYYIHEVHWAVHVKGEFYGMWIYISILKIIIKSRGQKNAEEQNITWSQGTLSQIIVTGNIYNTLNNKGK